MTQWLYQYSYELPIDAVIDSLYLVRNPEQHRLTPKYHEIHLYVPLVKYLMSPVKMMLIIHSKSLVKIIMDMLNLLPKVEKSSTLPSSMWV